MPRLDDSGEALLHAGENAKGRVKRVWDDFTDFLLSDNVLEVAVGLVYEFPIRDPVAPVPTHATR